MAVLVKTLNGLAYASVKTRNGLAIGSVKKINGLDVTSGGFNPATYGTVLVWLKADSLSLSDGDPVSTWSDSSGNGNDATSSSTARPTYKTNILNGLPILRFDGSNDYIQGSSVISSTTLTAFVVGSHNVGSAGFPRLVSFGKPGTNDYDSPSRAIAFYSINNGTVYAYRDSLTRSYGSFGNGTYHQATCVYDGTNNTVYVDGPSAAGAIASSGTFDITIYSIGANTVPASSDFLDGDIAEVIIYSDALSTGNRQSVEDYLGTKYGITITH